MEFGTFTFIISILGIHLLAVMSPGPDFFMLVRNALLYSRRTGIYTAIGFGLGIGIHVSYSILGLAVIIKNTPILFNLIQYVGASYLIYMGILSIKSKDTHFNTSQSKSSVDISAVKAMRIGFLTNVLNPKATLFFLSLFTAIMSKGISNILVLGLGITMMINTTIWFSLLALMLTHSKILPLLEKNQKLFNSVFGVLLIGIGLQIVISSILDIL